MAERAEAPSPVAAPVVDRGTASPGTAPASLGQLVELGGPLTPRVVLTMQERVGNQATTAWLSRNVLPPPAAGQAGPRDEIIEMAARFIPNPVHYKLTKHYGYGRGAPLRLTPDDVLAMNARLSVLGWPAVSQALREADDELRRQHADPEREQAGHAPVIPVGAEVRRHVTADGPAVANGSLANCHAYIDGEVIADREGGHFEGTVEFRDYWDFDPKLWDTIRGSSGRTWIGEIETIIGWAFLPGDPFDVTTELVRIVQHPGFGHAELSR
jgi:hypothetical protein